MIHFDFIVEDVDAENIFHILNSEIANLGMDIIELMASDRPHKESYVQGLRSHQEYIRSIIAKMKNTRVKDEPI